MSTIGENIQKLRESADLSQTQLGSKIGKTRSAVSQYESGKIIPRMGVIEDLATVFRVSKSEIIGDSPLSIPGARPVRGVPMVEVPLVGRVHAGPAGDPDVYEDADETVEIPQTYLDIDPECVAVDFEGDCMLPDFGDATTLVVSPNSPFGNGSIVVVAVDSADYVVRRMEQTARELRLKASNPAHDDIVIPRDEEHDVEFKGKVLGCFKRFE